MPPPLSSEVDGLRRALGDGSLHRIPAHLTLVPPVNVAEDRLGEALAVVREAAGVTAPLTVELGPPATFLPHNPVLYLAAAGDVAALRSLRDRVLRGPLERLGAWEFVPHVTLADDAATDVIEAALVALGRYRAEVAFDRLHVLRQRRDRVWEPIAEAPFARPAVIGRGGLPVELVVTDGLDPEGRALLELHDGEHPFAVTARRELHVVGTAVGAIRGDRAHLDRLVVEAARRRQGVGSHLLAAVESLAAERGCSLLTTEVTPGGPGEAFLRARGWTDGASGTVRLVRIMDLAGHHH